MDWGQKGEKTRKTPNRANLDGERIEEDLARQNHVLLSLNCSSAWDREHDPADLRGLYALTSLDAELDVQNKEPVATK